MYYEALCHLGGYILSVLSKLRVKAKPPCSNVPSTKDASTHKIGLSRAILPNSLNSSSTKYDIHFLKADKASQDILS